MLLLRVHHKEGGFCIVLMISQLLCILGSSTPLNDSVAGGNSLSPQNSKDVS